MSRTAISTDKAPAAIGTYSQAMKVGSLVFLSGQIPLSPSSGELVSEDFVDQIEQVLDNLAAVCEAAGGGLNDCVKLSVFLKDLANFSHVNTAMEKRFHEPFPARAAFAVADLPRGAQVEIEGVMLVPGSAD
ncbi:MAG: RidA family protein [Pseudomonadaceae bacterium]|nr:RidA family protein [Pseudomonadaceae bacterium]